MEDSVEYGLEFSKEKLVDTTKGTRTLKKATPTESFWKAWKEDKEALKKQGDLYRNMKISGAYVYGEHQIFNRKR